VPRDKPYVRKQSHALWLGVGATIAGALLLWDGYEHRGKKRPFLLRWIPAG
jgi:hypothetical protein